LNAVERRRWKFAYLVVHQRGVCPIWHERGRRRGWNFARPGQLHHRLHNTNPNRRRFPLFLHSLLNLAAVNQAMHEQHPSWGRPSLLQAERIERTLRRWPRACAFVNGRALRLDWRT
jgi:hypothetical protein